MRTRNSGPSPLHQERREKAVQLLPAALAISLSVFGAAHGAPDPQFALQFAAAPPLQYEGIAGERFGPFEVVATLTPAGLRPGDGPSGWTIGVVHDPLIELLQITLEGTDAGALLDGGAGFQLIEILAPERNGGLLGYLARVSLPVGPEHHLRPDRLSTLASATYRGHHPWVAAATRRVLKWEYRDGLRGAADDPAQNGIEFSGSRYPAAAQPLERTLITHPSCNASMSLAIDSPSSEAHDDRRSLSIDVPAGQEFFLDVAAKLDLSLPEGTSGGVEAWSLSVMHELPFFEAVSASAEDSDALAFSNAEARFVLTDLVEGDAGAGFISAVILSLAEPRTLPPRGSFSLARARYRLVAPHDEPGPLPETLIRFKDGLESASAPVRNIITFEGTTQKACWKLPLEVSINVTPRGKVFLRGDANNDSRVNLSDVVWLASLLFQGGSESVCAAADDANGDGKRNLSDLVRIIDLLFRRSAPLLAPFPSCGAEADLHDPLPCDESSVKCP